MVAMADRLADEQHGRLVALALADHHRAVDRKRVELAPHRVDRGLVGRLFVAASAKPRRRHRGTLGNTHDLERQDALEPAGQLVGDRRHRRKFPFLMATFFGRFFLAEFSWPKIVLSRFQLFSIRITCGFSAKTPSCSIAASARRTASSEVA
jgi:hypothetical protein